MPELSTRQRALLQWISAEDVGGQVGECDGPDLDALVDARLVQIGSVPNGRTKEFAWATLTDAGWAALGTEGTDDGNT